MDASDYALVDKFSQRINQLSEVRGVAFRQKIVSILDNYVEKYFNEVGDGIVNDSNAIDMRKVSIFKSIIDEVDYDNILVNTSKRWGIVKHRFGDSWGGDQPYSFVFEFPLIRGKPDSRGSKFNFNRFFEDDGNQIGESNNGIFFDLICETYEQGICSDSDFAKLGGIDYQIIKTIKLGDTEIKFVKMNNYENKARFKSGEAIVFKKEVGRSKFLSLMGRIDRSNIFFNKLVKKYGTELSQHFENVYNNNESNKEIELFLRFMESFDFNGQKKSRDRAEYIPNWNNSYSIKDVLSFPAPNIGYISISKDNNKLDYKISIKNHYNANYSYYGESAGNAIDIYKSNDSLELTINGYIEKLEVIWDGDMKTKEITNFEAGGISGSVLLANTVNMKDGMNKYLIRGYSPQNVIVETEIYINFHHDVENTTSNGSIYLSQTDSIYENDGWNVCKKGKYQVDVDSNGHYEVTPGFIEGVTEEQIVPLKNGYELVYTKTNIGAEDFWASTVGDVYIRNGSKRSNTLELSLFCGEFNLNTVAQYNDNKIMIIVGGGHEGEDLEYFYNPKTNKLIDIYDTWKVLAGETFYEFYSVAIEKDFLVLKEYDYCCDTIDDPKGHEKIVIDANTLQLKSREPLVDVN